MLIHVAFSQNFDGALSPWLPMHAHSHLTEGTRAQNFSDAIEIAQTALLSGDKILRWNHGWLLLLGGQCILFYILRRFIVLGTFLRDLHSTILWWKKI